MKKDAPFHRTEVLPREEYVEQAYLFKTLRERMTSTATQELMLSLRHEILATTQLPMAMEFMYMELKHSGEMTPAMRKMTHYFTPFQTYIMMEAEREGGKFDFQTALEILEKEASCRANGMSRPGMFMYQLEAVSRNRLRYDMALAAMADDPIYNDDWREWILIVRRQLGIIEIADLIYVRSEYYRIQKKITLQPPEKPVLFGEKEGRIALATRRKDPVFLFSALQRHLDYPTVPRRKSEETEEFLLPKLLRTVDKLEARVKLLEEEMRGGIDITRFYVKEK
ncbi:MAG: hypothetical protein Q4C96_08700 [Planctomycetia bacterium]|nr:hypothetical protein [Planctomycetia bacterium]